MSMLLPSGETINGRSFPATSFPATLYPMVCPQCGQDTDRIPQGLVTARMAADPPNPVLGSDIPNVGERQELAVFPGYEVLSVLGRSA